MYYEIYLVFNIIFSFNILNATSFVDSVRKSFGKESGCYNNSMKDEIKLTIRLITKRAKKQKVSFFTHI